MQIMLLILLVLFVAPIPVWAQGPADSPVSKTTDNTAVLELDAVIAEASKLTDKPAIVNVKSRAAALVSFSDPIKSELMFTEIWRFSREQSDKDFDKEKASTTILTHLFPRNTKLAKQFLSEVSKADESSLESRATGRDPSLRRMANLAFQLVDQSPLAASELLEQSLSTGVTPSGLNALLQLREKDSLIADFVVAKGLDGLRSQPDVVSLSGLHLLSSYVFPEGNITEINSSLESLQIQYYSTTYDVLKASLAQSEGALLKDRRYAEADLRFRSLYQARISLTLAALAPRYRPDQSNELNALADKLGRQLPNNLAQLAKFSTARLSGKQTSFDDPEIAIPLAIQSGNFEEARRLVDDLKGAELKRNYSQLLAKLEAKAHLAKSDVMGSLTKIRDVEDRNARLLLYLEAIKAAQKKRDAHLSSLVINEARTLIPQVARNGLHVRALLTFAAQLTGPGTEADAVEFLANAVSTINALSKQPKDESDPKTMVDAAMAELNDPMSLLEAPEMERAFSSVGLLDLEQGLTQARRIEPRAVQLVARLETLQGVLKRMSLRLKATPKPLKVSPALKQ